MISDVENELFTMETTTLTELTHEDEEELQEQEEIEEPPEKQSKQGPVSKLLGYLFEVNVHTPLHSDRVCNKMELYRTETTLQLDADPLQWWYERRKVYPIMSRLVRKFFHLACSIRTPV